MPLLNQGTLSGILYLENDLATGAFTESRLVVLNMLASQAAISIENAQLYGRLEEYSHTLEQKVELRTTELATATKEAELAQQAAENANANKSAFLANMSHELRTPLNAIIGFTRIVKRRSEDILPDKQIDNLDKVLQSSNHLLNLINTILDIAKIEAGRMDVQANNFSVYPLIDTCLVTIQPLVKTGVALEKNVAPDLPMMYSDQARIKQILINLLSNAAKFTANGRIILTAHQEEEFIYFAVIDTGIGISEEALLRVFEEFQQADINTRQTYGGTGLGLPISRSLAHLLGGDIIATSQIGKGSMFALKVPIQYA
jgi:signal transduction histidine kinase